MSLGLAKRLHPVVVVLGLSACATPPPVRHVAFAPPPPATPTDKPPICAQPEELGAFNILALQTQMMQIALTCGADDKYDVFVRRFQPQLAAQRAILKSFFTRAYGKGRAQTDYDQYVTQLADAESTYNLSSGADFCKLSTPVLDQAIAPSVEDELTKFAAGVPVQQALNVQTCGTPGAPPATPEATPVRHRTKIYHRHYHHTKS